MVFEYLGDNLGTLIKYCDYGGIPHHMVKELCFHGLVGLDYLHRQLSVIHTDLKPENILLLSMIDLNEDPRRLGAPIVPPSGKDKVEPASSAMKAIKSLNGDLTWNWRKKIRKKAKKAALEHVGKEVLEENGKSLEPHALEISVIMRV